MVHPARSDAKWQMVLSINGKFFMEGINYRNKQNMHSVTVKGYVLDAGRLFVLRDFPKLVNFDDKDKWVNIVVSNLERGGNIPTQQNPLTNYCSTKLFIMADVAHENLVEPFVYNIVALGRIIGP